MPHEHDDARLQAAAARGSDAPESTAGATGARDEAEAVAALLAADTSGTNGDDAAIVTIPGGLACVTTDLAVDGLHLHPQLTPWEQGYRAAACALSDLVAMAAQPRAVVCAIAVPPGRWTDVTAIAAGVEARAREHGCGLVGGDMASSAPAGSSAPLSVTVTCIGAGRGPGRGGLVHRHGMRAGDAVFVTGTLGASRAARLARDESLPGAAWERYVRPPNRQRAGFAIARFARSMCDVSDGVAKDARALATASGCGISIDLDLLPVDESHRPLLARLGDTQCLAATSGDDYELLFACDPAAESELRTALAAVDEQLRLTRIGKATERGCVFQRDGAPVDDLEGFVHR